MSEVQPVWKRELLIDDDDRAPLRDSFNPLIHKALLTRGYTEVRTSDDRLLLDSSTLLPSRPYINLLQEPFDTLKFRNEYDVRPGETQLTRSEITLGKVGGFSVARFIKIGDTFKLGVKRLSPQPQEINYQTLDEEDGFNILEDIHAQTTLGYDRIGAANGNADTLIRQIEDLSTRETIERRASVQFLTDEDHGDIQANLGENRLRKDVLTHNKLTKRTRLIGTLFELTARQPLPHDGVSRTGVHYVSRGKNTRMRLTTEISGGVYTDEQKVALYQRTIEDFQRKDNNRFGNGVIRNLTTLADPNADIVRVG